MKSFSFIFLIALSLIASSQKKEEPISYSPGLDSLIYWGKILTTADHDIKKYEANENFRRILIHDLSLPESIHYCFDTLKFLSVQKPEKGDFKIFTWSLLLERGKCESQGIILKYSSSTRRFKVVELSDVKYSIEAPEKETLKNGKWYGALYYKIITNKYKGETFYTLLGWDGLNEMTQVKLIDILYFDSKDMPVFGKLVFRGMGKTAQKRVLFRYSDESVMALNYEKQGYTIKNTKVKTAKVPKKPNNTEAIKADKKVVKEKRLVVSMIAFNRLMPLRDDLAGMYQFYSPELNIVDGFLFSEGKWVFIKDVDARNKETTVDKKTWRPIQKGLVSSE